MESIEITHSDLSGSWSFDKTTDVCSVEKYGSCEGCKTRTAKQRSEGSLSKQVDGWDGSHGQAPQMLTVDHTFKMVGIGSGKKRVSG